MSKTTWQAYARKDGKKGIRNRVLVVYTVKCAEFVAQQIVIRKQMRELEDMSVQNWKAQRQIDLLAKNLEYLEAKYIGKEVKE